jgi:uncharacterized membrane protein
MLDRLARILGYFSIALGLVQLVAPRRLLALVGIPPSGTRVLLIRAVGARELAVGAPLSATGSASLVAARVVGDVVDLLLMVLALRARDTARGPLRAATAAVAAISAVDAAVSVAGLARSASEPQVVRKAVTIARPPDEVYAYWRALENLPRFMAHLESVRETGPRQSHWVAKAPAGTVAWDAELEAEEPGALLAWRSLPGADVDSAGRVSFIPRDAGTSTEVLVEMTYRPPAGGIGAAVAKLFGDDPSQQVPDDLRRLKQILETGEVTRSEATAAGERLRQHPAQPRADGPAVAAFSVGGDTASAVSAPAPAIVEEVPA